MNEELPCGATRIAQLNSSFIILHLLYVFIY